MIETLPKHSFDLEDPEIVKASRSPRSIDQRPDIHRSYLIPVLLKAFNVMECVRRNGPSANVKSIARELGYPHSTVYRIVRTLVACGYLADHEIMRMRLPRSKPEQRTHSDRQDAPGNKFL